MPQETKVRMTKSGYFEKPNAIVDELAAPMPDATYKVYDLMIRKTYGWGQESDAISFSQIEVLSGKSRPTVAKCCKELVESGLLEIVGKGAKDTNIYRVNELTSKNIELAVNYFNQLKNLTVTSKNSLPEVVKKFNTQKKTPQKKIKESISTAVMSADNDSSNTLPAVLNAEQAQPVAKKLAKPVDKEKRAANVACWNAYSIAYANRYGVDPIRNAKTNAMVAKIVEYVGRDDAPLIAAHYLTDNSFFYTNSGHDLSLLLRDFQKLRQQWLTGRKSTTTQARQADETQSRLSAFDSLAAKYAAEQE